MITIPYICHKILKRVAKYLSVELEKKLNTQVFFVIKRKIETKFKKGQNE